MSSIIELKNFLAVRKLQLKRANDDLDRTTLRRQIYYREVQSDLKETEGRLARAEAIAKEDKEEFLRARRWCQRQGYFQKLKRDLEAERERRAENLVKDEKEKFEGAKQWGQIMLEAERGICHKAQEKHELVWETIELERIKRPGTV